MRSEKPRQGNSPLVTIIAIIAMVAITVLLLRVDWEKVIKDGRRSGFWVASKTMLGCMFRFTGMRDRSRG